MRLKKILLSNFRSYSGENYINIQENITTLIGRNDAGKSTILDALDIFFNNLKPESEDLCKSCSTKEIVIGCVFDDLPKELTIDTTAKTTLGKEFLLNEEGNLEILKIFKSTEKTLVGPEIFIRALHPTKPGFNNLLSLKNEDLKQKGSGLGAKITDKRQNNLWRKAIWGSVGDLNLKTVDLPVDEFEPKAQNMYANLESLFPQYFLLKADRQATDSDPEARDPIQVAVKEAQKICQAEINDLENKIKNQVMSVTERALDKLKEMDPKLAQKLEPVLKSAPRWSFDYKIQDDRGISINKRGSGTRRLVLLNFFRAEAEHKSGEKEGTIIYAIEEPETSQHPINQTLIIDSLIELSKDKKRQVLISTHSPELAERLPSNSIRFIETTGKEDVSTVYDGNDALVKAADSLGILTSQKFGSAEAIVVVEGNPDDTFLTHASDQFLKAGILPSSINSSKFLILPAGGIPGVRSWVQRYRLNKLGLPYLVFVDSDRLNLSDPPTENEKMCNDLNSQGIKAIYTKKRETENYINPSVVGPGVRYRDYDDAKNIISKSTSVSGHKVIDTFWTKMSAQEILDSSKYNSGGEEKYEIQEIIEEILKLIP